VLVSNAEGAQVADFNPYREWLGVTAPGRPPDHYSLLGLNRYEDDVATVRRAADAQKSRVRSVRPGPHAAEWSRILDELDAARECLSTSDKKAAYDDELRRQPLPEESVLEDPTEQAPTAASSILAESADSDVAKTAGEQKSASGDPKRAAQPIRNLLPPGFEPKAEPDHGLSADDPEPADSQPVESLTRNILPPTFGSQQPAVAQSSPTPAAPNAAAPNAAAVNPSAPTPSAPPPSAPIANPAPVVATPSTSPPNEAPLPQNPAAVVAPPSAPIAAPANMGHAFNQPTPAASAGYIQTPQTSQTPFAQTSLPQSQHEDQDDDLLPPMAIPLTGSSTDSATSPSTAAPTANYLASPIPVRAAATGTAVSGSTFGAPMGATHVAPAYQPIGLAGPTPVTQLSGPYDGNAVGGGYTMAGASGTGTSGPTVTAQTPSARAAAGRSKLSVSSLVAIAASLFLLLAAGGIFVRNRLANEPSPQVTSLDGLNGSQENPPDGSRKDDRRTRPDENANSTANGGGGKHDSDENVRPATFVEPIDDPSPITSPGPINDPSPVPMPTPQPAPSLDPVPTPDPAPAPDPGPAPDPAPKPDPGPPQLPPDQNPFDPSPIPPDTSPDPKPDPMPAPAPMPDPEPALSAMQLKDFEWTLKEVKSHLAERDVYTAKALIGKAKEIAKKGKPGAHTEKLERLELLAHYVDEFWGAVLEGLPDLEGKDLEVGSAVVHIQAVSQNTIAYRAGGRNFKKQRFEWPAGLVRAIAENWLDKKPKSKIFVGAFMAVDKSYGPEKAREQWEQALAGDAETVEAVQKVMPVLNEL
jgi:hypothetical protein